AKAEYLQAYAQLDNRTLVHEQAKALRVEKAVPEARVVETLAQVNEAKFRLLAAQQALINLGFPVHDIEVKGQTPEDLAKRVQFLGLPPEVVKELDPATTTANLIAVRAAHDGTVIEVKVRPGEVLERAKTQFVIADTSKLWLVLNVRQEDMKFL